jgi:1-acyl-sn-glycerol-3-phosphate acyltransferase
MHHIPVDRSAGAAAYAHALEALRSGEIVGVFPESTIARSYVQRPLKSGAARLAIEAGVPLIPVLTWGGHRVWTSGRRPRWQRRVPVILWVDQPLAIAADDTPATLTDKLAARLRELLDEALAAYPATDEDRRSWWWPAHLGGAAPTPEAAAATERSSGSRPRSA